MSLDREKSEFRKTSLASRRWAAEKSSPDALVSLSDHLVAQFGEMSGQIVSGYLAIGTEINVAPAIARLEKAGLVATLPVVTAAEQPLTFFDVGQPAHKWSLVPCELAIRLQTPQR